MKLSIKLLLVVLLLLAVVAPLVIKGPGGKPIMSLSDWLPQQGKWLGLARQAARAGDNLATDSLHSIEQMTAGGEQRVDKTEAVLEAAPPTLGADSGKMYKWQDEQGRWHFSSQKPDAAIRASLEDLPDVKNVIDTPVDDSDKGSMMGMPGLGNLGEMLEKVQSASTGRNQ